MNKLYNNTFADLIRQRINNGDFKEKSDLINYLKNINSIVMNDSVLMQRLKEDGIILNGDELEDIAKLLLEYYDKQKTDLTSLNLDGISQFEIGDKDYIKVRNADGTYDVLDDSMNDKTFIEQMQERQNESVNLQTANAVKNREEIIKDMKEDKEAADLTASTNVNVRDLTPEERIQFRTMMHMSDADEINFVVDTERNIYINKDTGETYYVHKNQFNQLEVRKAEETTAQTIKQDTPYVDENGKEQVTVTETPVTSEFDNLDEYELQFIVNNKFDSLTPEQQKIVLQLLDRKKEMKTTGNETIAKQNELGGKQYVKKLLNQPYNGFANVISLSFITLILGLLMLGCLIFKISI